MLLFVEAHPDKTLKTPETLSLCVRQINTAEKRKRKKQQSRWRQSHDKRSASDWESERERESVCGVWKGVCVCSWKHIVPVSHIQASPTDAPCSQVLSQLITLPETTPHCQEFTAKSNNYFADLGDYCIMGAYSHTQSPVTVTPKSKLSI